MICPQCKFENKDGAAFCAQCGTKLIEVPAAGTDKAAEAVKDAAKEVKEDIKEEAKEVKDTVEEAAQNAAKEEKNISEESTTVLTADMLREQKSEESTTVLTADMLEPKSGAAPMGNAPMGNAPMGNGPMGQPQGMMPPMGNAPMGQPGQVPMNPQGKQPKAAKQPKEAKQPKQPKQKSGKKNGGVIAYVVVSILLILGLIGTGVWGYLHYEKKLDNLNEEKDNVTKELEQAKADITSKDSEIDGLETQLDTLSQDNETLQNTVSDYETQIAELTNSFAAYETLISFVNDTAIGQGYDDFFTSDTVVHLSGGAKSIKVFFLPEEGSVGMNVADGSVATCSWQEGWGDTGYVGTIDITPVATGSTIITLNNDVNDEIIKIYVIVD